MVSADLIQHFHLNSWHPQLLLCCCVHRDSEQILYKASMPIMTSAIGCVIWVFSLPLSSIAYVSMQRSVLQSVAGLACNCTCGLIKEISCWLL